jgi:hypothetical protein
MTTNDNPAFGANLQPFMGIPSFMRRPVTRDLVEVSPPYDHSDITSILAANLAF